MLYACVIGKHPVLTHAVDIGTAQLYSVPVTLIVIQNTFSPHCELSQLMQKFYWSQMDFLNITFVA